MGIDSIGKKGPPLPSATGVGGASPSAGAHRSFEVAGARGATKVDAASGPRTALERLRAGEIDVHGYVDIKVNEATSHLAGLSPSELDRVRSALRARMVADPTLVDLVRTATGSVPATPTDE
jgi:hypothetical protein